MGLGDALGAYRQALKSESVPALADAAKIMAEAIEDHIISEATKAGNAVVNHNVLLPEFVSVVSRTGTSARAWCDHCDFGSNGWVSPREAFDWAYGHVRERHNNLT